MTEGVAGKVVIVTGASSGLGEAAARRLAAGGAHLLLGARRLDRIQALAKELGQNAETAVATDVVDFGSVAALADRAIQLHGRIDVFMNNAGIMPHSPFDRLKVDDWDRMVDVNIKGVLHGIGAVLPQMQRQKSGHIINVSSVAGHKIRPGAGVYAATKHAVRAVSEGLRQDVKPYNIRVTTISPGAVSTELSGSITEPDIAASFEDYYRTTAVPADSFARCVLFAISQPEDIDINEILYRPTRQLF